MTNKLLFIGYVSLMLKAVSCGKSGKGKENDSKAKEIVNTQHMTYEREAFSFSYPNTYNCKSTRTAFPTSCQGDNSMTAKARKRIETIFPQLTDQFFVIRNYAKTTNGLFARIIGKISALTILQCVNLIRVC